MLKKISKFIVGSLLIFSFHSTVFASFSDVAEGDKHFAATEYLKQKGVINGYADNTFKPAQSINRAEALKIVLLAKQLLKNSANSATSTGNAATTENAQGQIKFPDVKPTDWFYIHVKNAFAGKIIEGYPDGTFKPANTINASESLKIILLAFEVPVSPINNNSTSTSGSSTTTDGPYPDVNSQDWFAPYVQFAKDKQLIEASGNGNYIPNHEMSRGEFAETIYRLMYVTENKIDKFPMNLNWKSYQDAKGNFIIQYPFGWEKIETQEEVIFWKKDAENNQMSFARTYPNSAVLTIATDSNSKQLSLEQYIAQISYENTVQKQVLTLNNFPFAMFTITEQGLQDNYFEMPNHAIVAVYSQVGAGPLKDQLKEEIRYMLGSLKYGEGKSSPNSLNPSTLLPSSSAVSDQDTLLSKLREKILVKGVGKKAIETLGDAFIAETDSVGIGTGPIDYYYSSKNDVSVKLERNSDTILGVKSSRTSSF